MPLDTHDEYLHPTIDFITSPVIEAISAVAGLIQPSHYAQVASLEPRLRQGLTTEVQQFLSDWREQSPFDLLSLLDVMLPLSEFQSVEAFIAAMNACDDVMFLYHFFEMTLHPEVIEACLHSPEQSVVLLQDSPLAIYTQTHADFIRAFFKRLPAYRRIITQLLEDIDASLTFRETFRAHQAACEEAIVWAQSLSMEPLALAQRLMGKNFQRISAYTHYTFVPSHFVSPRRVRVFDSTHCMVIFGWDQAESDPRIVDADLERKAKALADANRIAMLRMLSRSREYGARLAENLGLTGATVSHHLDILKRAGFIREEKVGNIKYFSLDEQGVEMYVKSLQQHIQF